MAIKATVKTMHGEYRELYIRLNNISVSNHGQPSNALFRGFISKDAFDSKAHYIHEETMSFNTDVALPIWEQAYTELKIKYPESEDC